MKLIVGLGNPGTKYANTRHNVGFMFLDKLAEEKKVGFQLEKKLKSEIASFMFNGEKIILIKPQTFMNLSGEAVRAVKDFYRVEVEDILVIYDDLDLPTGKLRIRKSGSAGGHNGMANIMLHLGVNEVKRLRIGIDKSEKIEVVDYVLGQFQTDEKIAIALVLDRAVDMIETFLTSSFDQFMNRHN